MVVITLLFIAFHILITTGVNSKSIVYPCQTPDDKEGFCVSIFDCPELIKLAYENGLMGANFAKESVCLGRVNNDTWVCCKKPRYIDMPLVSPTEDIIPTISESKESLAIRKKNNLEKLNNNFKFCGQQHSAYRVGQPGEIEIDEYPWLVQIKHDLEEPISMRCNGVIIEKRYILTTSKCGYQARTVLLGQYNINENVSCKKTGGQEADCTEPTKELSVAVVAHSNRAPDDQYGLTLLNVSEIISYTDYVRPICLPLNRTELSTTEKELRISGWLDVSGNKKEVRYQTSSPEECFNIDQQLKEKVKEENISLICLSKPYPELHYCDFDFGGPLMYQHQYNQWHLDGFISNGYPKDGSICSISNITGIYLTPKLIDFIISNIVL